MTRRVVITGGAALSPLGFEDDAIFERLHQYENCVTYMPDWEKYEQINTRLAAPIPFAIPEFSRKMMRGMGRGISEFKKGAKEATEPFEEVKTEIEGAKKDIDEVIKE